MVTDRQTWSFAEMLSHLKSVTFVTPASAPSVKNKSVKKRPKMHFPEPLFKHFWQRKFFFFPQIRYLEKSAKSTKSWQKIGKMAKYGGTPPFSPKKSVSKMALNGLKDILVIVRNLTSFNGNFLRKEKVSVSK